MLANFFSNDVKEIDGKQVQTVDFEATTNPTAMEGLDQIVMVHAPAGEHWVAVSALRQFAGLPAKYAGLNPTLRPEPPAASRPAFTLPDSPDAACHACEECKPRRPSA